MHLFHTRAVSCGPTSTPHFYHTRTVWHLLMRVCAIASTHSVSDVRAGLVYGLFGTLTSLLAFPAGLFSDYVGIRWSLFIAACLNCVGRVRALLLHTFVARRHHMMRRSHHNKHAWHCRATVERSWSWR